MKRHVTRWTKMVVIVGVVGLACGGPEPARETGDAEGTTGAEAPDATFAWHEEPGCGSTLSDDLACQQRGPSCEMEVPPICLGATGPAAEARARQEAEQRARTLRCACRCDVDRRPCMAP